MKKELLNRPDVILGMCLLGLLLLGQWQRISFGEISFYGHDLVVGGWLIDLWRRHGSDLMARVRGQFGSLGGSTKITLGLLLAAIGLGWLLNLDWSAGVWALTDLKWPLLYLGRAGAYLSLAWTILQVRPFSARELKVATSVTVLTTLMIGLSLFLILPDMRWMAILGWDNHYYRLVGSQLDPGFAGLILIFGFWWSLTQAKAHERYFWLGVALMSLLAVTITWSRASYLSLFVSLGWAAFLGQRFLNLWQSQWGKGGKILVLMAAIFLSLIFITPKPAGEGGNLNRTSTIETRVSAGSSRLNNLSGGDWLIGQGLLMVETSKYNNDFERQNHAKLPDNIFVTLAVGMGAIGLLLISTLVWQSRKNIQIFLVNFPLAPTLLVAILIHSQFNNSLLQPFVGLYWLMFLITEKRVLNK